ncbi:MAG: MYG1 family protein [Clostridiales bacterium]|nr:MYG1 family protein [Clostridiales bacterium]
MDNIHQIPQRAFTHSGKFHADDVFSAALLTYLNPKIQIERGYEVPDDYDGIVFDIGGGEYDHHHEGAPVRENGVPYGAFGLLWKSFGTVILTQEEAEHFDESFVQPLDLSDNTGSKNEVAEIISLFNPPWDSEIDQDQCFLEAKSLALTILRKKFEHIESSRRAEGIVGEALANAKNQIAVLSQGVPWKKFIIGTDIEFVIYPSDRGGYCAQGVPLDRDTKELKIYFPEEWRGKRGDELRESSGIGELHFCHNSGFLVATDTVEGAIKACVVAKERQQESP